MCEHLIELERHLSAIGIPLTFRGQPWSSNCREWAFFACYLELAGIRQRITLSSCVIDHINADTKSGEERGFVCTEHHDAIMGYPRPSEGYPTVV